LLNLPYTKYSRLESRWIPPPTVCLADAPNWSLYVFMFFKPWDARIDTQMPKFRLVSHCWACSLIEDSYAVPCGFLLIFFIFYFFSFCRLKCVICLDFQSKESLFLSWVQFMPNFQVKVQLLASILYIGATKSRFF
jgi:hypothetical protein